VTLNFLLGRRGKRGDKITSALTASLPDVEKKGGSDTKRREERRVGPADHKVLNEKNDAQNKKNINLLLQRLGKKKSPRYERPFEEKGKGGVERGEERRRGLPS